MTKIRFLMLGLSMVLFLPIMRAQEASEKIKPQWLHKLPRPTNPTFIYKITSASSASLDQAREKSLSELITATGLKSGAVVVSDSRTKKNVSQVWNNGKLTEHIDYNFATETSAKGAEVKIYVENIAEYWKKDHAGNYYLTKLYAMSEFGERPLFDNVELTTFYAGHGLWRSAIVPGWGQFYKGSYLKGGLVLGGTVALAAGIIYTNSMRSDYANKIVKTHITENKRTYATKRDNYTTGRNICIGGLAALYVYNLVDAIVAPGARRIIVHRSHDGKRNYSFEPTVLGDGSPGLATAMTF